MFAPKNTKFVWSPTAQEVFDALQSALSSHPVLHYYDSVKPCTHKTDASNYALGAVSSQYDDDDHLHLIVFCSHKLLPAEMNYQMYHKEFTTVVAFKHWHHYLGLFSKLTVVLTDDKNLEYFTTSCNLQLPPSLLV